MKIARIQMSVVALAVSLFLAACQTPNVRQDYDPGKNVGSALIVGSVTQTPGSGKFISGKFYVDYRKGGGATLLHSKHVGQMSMFTPNDDQFENPDVEGRVFVVKVPPGVHRLNHWEIESGGGGGYSLYPKNPPPPLEFEVEAGQIVYLGNLHMAIDSEPNLVGILEPVGGRPEIHDESARDLDLIRAHYPNLKDSEITVKVQFQGAWEDEASKNEKLEIPRSH